MRMRRVFVSLAASACLCTTVASAQEAPSLGDVARQARLQKQQKDAAAKKDGVSKDPSIQDAADADPSAKNTRPSKAPHVITNDDIPSHAASASTSKTGPQPADTSEQLGSVNAPAAAEQWKFAIQTQKSAIASLQGQIDSLNDSVHYAGANCVENCVQWNERQKQKQDQVENMKSQLEQQQKRLEDLQEAARKQGFGSSVYDP
jgi:hypothetical protein